MASIKDYKVESDVAVGGSSITAIVDGEEQDDVEIIGHLISYTIGSDFVVPREWLKGRMEELDLYIDLPGEERKLMIPPKVTPKRAFNRTRDRLVDGVANSHPEFYSDGKREMELMGSERVVQFESKKATRDEWHITAEAFFKAEELGAEYDDGEFRQVTVGVFRYNKENEGILGVPKVDEEDNLWGSWELFAKEANKMFAEHQNSHVGRDIQKMLNRYTHHWTDTIKVRDGGAVYFVPAGYDDSVRALKTLIDEIDEQYKHRGRDCEILRISVTDSEEERKQIEEKARKHVEEQAEAAMNAAFEALTEDESVADDIAEELEGRLEGLDGFADDYNALLNARLSAQEVLRDRLDSLKGEKEKVVKKALERAEKPEA